MGKSNIAIRLIVLACENQDEIHYAIPVRNMLYDALNYVEFNVTFHGAGHAAARHPSQ